jgi:hypothetical protein
MPLSKFAANYVRNRTTQRMGDKCVIFKPGGMQIDPVTRKAQRAEREVKYEGICRFWEIQAGAQSVIGDQQVVVTQSFLSLPYDAPVPESDDIVQIVESADPDLVGRTVQVVSIVRGGGLRASRKFIVRLVDSQKASW